MNPILKCLTLARQVCEDLVKMINEEARVEAPGDKPLTGPPAMDYTKPFKLFDEQGKGIIPVDRFRLMLYRLHVNSLLRERQVVALIDRFDVHRNGELRVGQGMGSSRGRSHGAHTRLPPDTRSILPR